MATCCSSFTARALPTQRALSFVNLYMYGGGFDMAAALADKVLPFGLFETRRLIGAVVGIIGLLATWRLGRRLGGPIAGLCALVLLATCPLYYGHMFMNAKDAPFATAMIVLLLGIVRVIDEYPKPGPRTLVLAGIGLGLAFGSRILAAIAAPAGLAALLLIVVTDARASSLRASGARLVAIHLADAAALGAGLSDHGPAVAMGHPVTAQSDCSPANISPTFSKSRGVNYTKAG